MTRHSRHAVAHAIETALAALEPSVTRLSTRALRASSPDLKAVHRNTYGRALKLACLAPIGSPQAPAFGAAGGSGWALVGQRLARVSQQIVRTTTTTNTTKDQPNAT